MHITPGVNGWASNANRMLHAIGRKELEKHIAATDAEREAERERAELEYYEENNCYPRPAGYFGAESDAHFYER